MWIDNFNYVEDTRKSFDVNDGDHRVAIVDAKLQPSKNNKRMIVLFLKVEGGNGVLYQHYLVEGEYFDAQASRIFDSFKIPKGNFNLQNWLNKVGYAHFVHREEEFTGSDGQQKKVQRAHLQYFHNNVPEAVPQQVTQVAAAVQGEVKKDSFSDIPF